MRKSLERSFELSGACTRLALALTATLGLGCAQGTTEIDAKRLPSVDAARTEESVPASDGAETRVSSRAETLYRQLREHSRRSSRESVVSIDESLRAAELEFPLEFRFSYERAKLVVFGRHEHHEAIGRLRRAAEKAIETAEADAMLEMLRSDGARDGPFWKLARGHSEWRQIIAALEHGDREALWHEHEEANATARVAPETHEKTEAHEASRTAASGDWLDRLRVVRARVGREEKSKGQDRPADTL